MADLNECSIRSAGGGALLSFEPGQSLIFVGANGSGKTRLGVYIEKMLPARAVQRVAAQKSLDLSDEISLVSLERADNTLRFGRSDGNPAMKDTIRWGSKPATHLLRDFDALLQTLFADHNRIATDHLRRRKATPDIPVPTTKLDQLKAIWEELLPHRSLEILEASLTVRPESSISLRSYPASNMSDGERAIFYFLGQCLLAPEKGVIIIDEPESHIHKAILGLLWDAIEDARPDCSFVYITHDVDFAATHAAADKYFIRSYNHQPQTWDLEKLPEDTGLPEQVVVEIVGSRKPILFVEGDGGSLDLTVYRNLYSTFTIVPVGSCEAVIHSVASFKKRSTLHRLEVRGLIDADDRGSTDLTELRSRDVYVLPVAEVENLLLLPDVFLALAEVLICIDLPALLESLRREVAKVAMENLELVSARYTARQIDRRLKRVTLSTKDLASLQTTYQKEIATINAAKIFNSFRQKLEDRIQSADLPGILQLYKNDGLVALPARLFGLRDQKQFLEKLARILGGESGVKVRRELSNAVPKIPV